jgi:fatty-acyl-CoA synthase
MPEVAIGYGMTETSPTSTFTRPEDSLERRVSSVGQAQPQVEISIRDPQTNQLLPRGSEGEFCARGYHVMKGYWNDPQATTRAIDAEGWMHSGDLASMDEEGYVHITGRLKDLIIRGGENIAPREVEAVLEQHPAISEAQVIGVPSRKYGEEVMAWVKFRPGHSASETELIEFCKSRMGSYKVPKFWQFVESFPMTVTGKIQKYRLRELAREILGVREEETA